MFIGWFFDAWFGVSQRVGKKMGDAAGSAVWMVVIPVLVTMVGSLLFGLYKIWS
jgi:hypothetical protein